MSNIKKEEDSKNVSNNGENIKLKENIINNKEKNYIIAEINID